MKRQLLMSLLVIFALVGVCQAADVQLAWDPSNPQPDSYVAFVREVGQQYDYSSTTWQVAGDTTTVTIAGLTEGTQYAFVVRASIGDHQSGDSNEILYTPMGPPQQIVIPQRVNGIKIIFE